MDKIKQQKFSIVMIVFSMIFTLLLLVAATLAWFMTNNQTNADNMQLAVEASPNLIISDSLSAAGGAMDPELMNINSGEPFAIVFTDDNGTYQPATHDDDYVTYTTGLKTVADATPANIGTASGIYIGNSYVDCEDGVHFKDYTVYVASHGDALTNAKMTVNISSAVNDSTSAEVTSGSLMAASIDVYKNSVSSANYLGTVNVAEKDPVYVVGGADSTGTIPLNTSNVLTFVLRCYFDGALENNGTAYINTATLDTSKVVINVRFTAQTY